MAASLFFPSGICQDIMGCRNSPGEHSAHFPLGTLSPGLVRSFFAPFSSDLSFHRAGARQMDLYPFSVQYWPAGETLRPLLTSSLFVDRVVAWSGGPSHRWVVSNWRQGVTYLLDQELNIISCIPKVYNWGSFLTPEIVLLFDDGAVSLWKADGQELRKISGGWSSSTTRPLFRGAGLLSRKSFSGGEESGQCSLPGDVALFLAERGSPQINCYIFDQQLQNIGMFPLFFTDYSSEVLLDNDDSFLTGGSTSLRKVGADGRGERSFALSSGVGLLSPLGRHFSPQANGRGSVLYLEEKEPGWRGPVLYSTPADFVDLER